MLNPVLNKSVLVLNQSYEPIQVCSVRRAIVLVFRGRAEVVESLDLFIRSVTHRFPVPSVVRLGIYIRVPQKKLTLSKRNVLKRDGHQCYYCGTRSGRMTVDHVIPRTQGGMDSWDNLVCACLKCNNLKGDRSPEQAGLAMLRKPRLPTKMMFVRHLMGVPDQHWRQYLFLD